MTHTHSLAEWLQMLSLAVGLYGSVSVPYFLAVDAEQWSWPHPLTAARIAAWDVARSEAVYLLLREWDTFRHLCREFGRDVAALLILLLTSPKGAMA